MTLRKWEATITFYAETPDDDVEADDMADRLSDALFVGVGALDAVDEDTVRVADLDTVPE